MIPAWAQQYVAKFAAAAMGNWYMYLTKHDGGVQGFDLSGNKVRKLEFLLADCLAKGCTVPLIQHILYLIC